MLSKSEVIENVCLALSDGRLDEAAETAKQAYPNVTCLRFSRRISETQATRVFVRDGFIDRYCGDRLIFPATLRLLSRLLPAEFPYHKNWKMSECHPMFWELYPTIDHCVPVGRGGTNVEANWITTSMLRNAAKANWTIEELGWCLLPAGDVKRWDGLTDWYLKYVDKNPSVREDKYLDRWYSAARNVQESTNWL